MDAAPPLTSRFGRAIESQAAYGHSRRRVRKAAGMRSSHGGREQGEDRKPQLVQVTGSSRRAWRWLIRGARRRGQYLAGCEPVCGGITCSGRQDACPRLSPIANRGTALRAARCRGHDHPSSAVLFGATDPLQRVVDSPRARSSADGRPPGPTCPTRRLCAAHAALSPPAALVFVLFVLWNCFADGPVRHRTTCRPEPAEGKAHSLPRCLTASLSRSLPHRRAASPPRCVAASSVRPSVRPSVRSSVPASLSLPPYSLSPPSVPRTPPSIPPSLTRSLSCSLPPPLLPPSFLPPSLFPLSPSLTPSLSLLASCGSGWLAFPL